MLCRVVRVVRVRVCVVSCVVCVRYGSFSGVGSLLREWRAAAPVAVHNGGRLSEASRALGTQLLLARPRLFYIFIYNFTEYLHICILICLLIYVFVNVCIYVNVNMDIYIYPWPDSRSAGGEIRAVVHHRAVPNEYGRLSHPNGTPRPLFIHLFIYVVSSLV